MNTDSTTGPESSVTDFADVSAATLTLGHRTYTNTAPAGQGDWVRTP